MSTRHFLEQQSKFIEVARVQRGLTESIHIRRIFRVVVYRVCRWARSFVTSVAASVLTAIPRHCLRADLFIFTVEHGVGSHYYLDLLQSQLEFLVADAGRIHRALCLHPWQRRS